MWLSNLYSPVKWLGLLTIPTSPGKKTVGKQKSVHESCRLYKKIVVLVTVTWWLLQTLWEEPPCSPWCEQLTDSGHEASSQVAVAWIQWFLEETRWTAILKSSLMSPSNEMWGLKKSTTLAQVVCVWKDIPVLPHSLSLSNKACPRLPIHSIERLCWKYTCVG